jgi:hypothetical protein
MTAAAYEIGVTASDDATFEFTCEWRLESGEPFPWQEYAFAYDLRRDGRPTLALSTGNGIEINEEQSTITFAPADPAFRLRPGRYEHGCRATHIETGKTIQLFDGTATIFEGNA